MREIRAGQWRFRIHTAATAVAAAGIVAMVVLGNWQVRRAGEKFARQQELDARAQQPMLALPSRPVEAADYVHRRVLVQGEFVPRHTVFVDNRVLRGLPGYDVVTPFRIGGGDLHVLVNRGWVALGPTRARLPQVSTPAGVLELEGVVVVPPERVYELSADAGGGPVVQHLVLARTAARTGLRLQPFIVKQTLGNGDGLARAWERPDAGVNTHRAYALQWYALGALILVLFVVLNLRRHRDPG